MASLEEQILRASKEVVVKFIETGRISPTSFPELFQSVYTTIYQTVNASPPEAVGSDSDGSGTKAFHKPASKPPAKSK